MAWKEMVNRCPGRASDAYDYGQQPAILYPRVDALEQRLPVHPMSLLHIRQNQSSQGIQRPKASSRHGVQSLYVGGKLSVRMRFH